MSGPRVSDERLAMAGEEPYARLLMAVESDGENMKQYTGPDDDVEDGRKLMLADIAHALSEVENSRARARELEGASESYRAAAVNARAVVAALRTLRDDDATAGCNELGEDFVFCGRCDGHGWGSDKADIEHRKDCPYAALSDSSADAAINPATAKAQNQPSAGDGDDAGVGREVVGENDAASGPTTDGGRTQAATPTLSDAADWELRNHLWMAHGHDGLYGDDGEMQCGRCGPPCDFKREPLPRLFDAWRAAAKERGEAIATREHELVDAGVRAAVSEVKSASFWAAVDAEAIVARVLEARRGR